MNEGKEREERRVLTHFPKGLYRWEGHVINFFGAWAVELDADFTSPLRKKALCLLHGPKKIAPNRVYDIIDALLKGERN